MENDVNIASRATLHRDMQSNYTEFKKEVSIHKDFHVECLKKLDPGRELFIHKNCLYGVLSCLDHLITDSLIRLFVGYPGKISKISLSVDNISDRTNVFDIITDAAHRRANEIAYKKPKDQIKEIVEAFGEKIDNIPDGALGSIVEAKATRDIFMHNGGVANWVYIDKAGSFSRVKDGQNIELSSEYINAVITSINMLGEWFKNDCIDVYKKDNKVTVFQLMWESSALDKHVKFDEMWDFSSYNWDQDYGGRYKGKSWGWSGSEEMLMDFFLRIFKGRSTSINHDIMDALARWRGYPEERLIMSWISSPFNF